MSEKTTQSGLVVPGHVKEPKPEPSGPRYRADGEPVLSEQDLKLAVSLLKQAQKTAAAMAVKVREKDPNASKQFSNRAGQIETVVQYLFSGALWVGLTRDELEELYKRLDNMTTDARKFAERQSEKGDEYDAQFSEGQAAAYVEVAEMVNDIVQGESDDAATE